ncbi:hypothetical protein [Gordonia iterans]
MTDQQHPEPEDQTDPHDHDDVEQDQAPTDDDHADTGQHDAGQEDDNPVVRRALADAKKYRLQLRDVEAERDELRNAVAGYHRDEVERLAAKELADPHDVWRDGLQLDDLLGENGRVDPHLTNEAIQNLVNAHPHWRSGRKRPDVGSLKSGSGIPPAKQATWSDVLRG